MACQEADHALVMMRFKISLGSSQAHHVHLQSKGPTLANVASIEFVNGKHHAASDGEGAHCR